MGCRIPSDTPLESDNALTKKLNDLVVPQSIEGVMIAEIHVL